MWHNFFFIALPFSCFLICSFIFLFFFVFFVCYFFARCFNSISITTVCLLKFTTVTVCSVSSFVRSFVLLLPLLLLCFALLLLLYAHKISFDSLLRGGYSSSVLFFSVVRYSLTVTVWIWFFWCALVEFRMRSDSLWCCSVHSRRSALTLTLDVTAAALFIVVGCRWTAAFSMNEHTHAQLRLANTHNRTRASPFYTFIKL